MFGKEGVVSRAQESAGKPTPAKPQETKPLVWPGKPTPVSEQPTPASKPKSAEGGFPSVEAARLSWFN
ncbi:hypothetical protein TWF481_002844 [Arthrobotrys musiformis]|uniref:Uncharacterized protein n=1 Tax=Arthrobotrys musiformis TaxID=47236 RepID=A0AAV9VT47_9PEZI